MDDDDFFIFVVLQLCLLALLQKKESTKEVVKSEMMGETHQCCSRPLYGDYDHLFKELRYNDKDIFFRYVRMRREIFDLLEMTKPFLIKSNHRAFSPEQRLTITLRYLATDDQILSITLAYIVPLIASIEFDTLPLAVFGNVAWMPPMPRIHHLSSFNI